MALTPSLMHQGPLQLWLVPTHQHTTISRTPRFSAHRPSLAGARYMLRGLATCAHGDRPWKDQLASVGKGGAAVAAPACLRKLEFAPVDLPRKLASIFEFLLRSVAQHGQKWPSSSSHRRRL